MKNMNDTNTHQRLSILELTEEEREWQDARNHLRFLISLCAFTVIGYWIAL